MLALFQFFSTVSQNVLACPSSSVFPSPRGTFAPTGWSCHMDYPAFHQLVDHERKQIRHFLPLVAHGRPQIGFGISFCNSFIGEAYLYAITFYCSFHFLHYFYHKFLCHNTNYHYVQTFWDHDGWMWITWFLLVICPNVQCMRKRHQ